MFNISKQDSAAIKGFLTILIAIGHNHIVAPQNSPLMAYLYTFHVTCFFILPWLYNNKKELTTKNIGNIIYRNWIPYIIFFVFSLGVFTVLRGKNPGIAELFSAFIIGSQKLLKENVGVLFLWFLPTFCTFSILKTISDNKKHLKYLLIILSLITFCFSWKEAEWMKNHLPFGFFVAIRVFVYGILVLEILRWKEWTKYIGATAFILLSYLYWKSHIGYGIIFMPITGFMLILSILPILRMRWLRSIGNYSLPIYLTHVFIYNALELIIPHTIMWGWLALILTIIIAYLISASIYRIEFIRKLIFPKSFNEWKGIFVFLLFLLPGCNYKESEKIIFIGDSLIRNWDTEKYMPFLEAENYGVDGYRMEDCNNIRVNDKEAIVVLLIGTNNLITSNNTKYAEEFAEKYIELVNGFTCKRIVCISILPKDGFNYKIIHEINKCIESKLKSQRNCIFLNVAEDFLYNGGMNPEYTVDGVHLNSKGYDLLSSKLCEVL
ncbi:acyltransferase family protein [Phocaeicola plebeius]|uniref:acyltransferase family protein n=1 Tax=Phocaeicola plebeius TaxID=310297 RepID=UPI0026F17D13|nr:acyltransferase family protein [Phocaeicola plebeius]